MSAWPMRARERGGFTRDLVDAPRLGLHAVERIQRVAHALECRCIETCGSTCRFDRSRPSVGARRLCAECQSPRIVLNRGGAMGDQALAAAAFRGNRPPGVAGTGRGLDRRRLGRRSTTGRSARPNDWALFRSSTFAAGPSLIELAALAAESDLVISNDTGPLHLAAAAGARVVGIYTCTSPKLTGPFRPASRHRPELRLVRSQFHQEMLPT